MSRRRFDVLPLLEDLTEKCQKLESLYEQAARCLSNWNLRMRCVFLWKERGQLVRELLDKMQWLGGVTDGYFSSSEEPPWEPLAGLTAEEEDELLTEGAESDVEMVAEYERALRNPLPLDIQMLLLKHRMTLKASEKAGLLDQLAQNSLQRDVLAQAVKN
jgi:hypothetical protein